MRKRGASIFVVAFAATLLVAAGVAAPAEAAAGSPRDAGVAQVEASPAAEEADAGTARGLGGRYDPRQRPAEGGAYFYRQIVFALVVMAGIGAVLFWIVRRAKRR